MVTDYVPSNPIFCNQCRERLIDDKLAETHLEYVCQACDARLILLEATKVQLGESACQCGSKDVLKLGKTALPSEALQAGGLADNGDDEVLEDTDWMRSGSGDIIDDNYEDMFDQDPGQN
jgi:DNA-directed RNA polymerase subunit RPC12/RpoP